MSEDKTTEGPTEDTVTFSAVNGEGSKIPQAAGRRPATAELVGGLPF